MNWSSGKDAALAYYSLLQDPQNKISHLLTTLSEAYNRVFMHGIREELLDAQAARMNLPLMKIKLPSSPDDNLYKNAMQQTFKTLKEAGVDSAAFGDIFLEDLRTYREHQLEQVGVQALFPLWKQDTRELVKKIELVKIEAIIVCVNERYLGKDFLGRTVNSELLSELPGNVDPCGENGEFHTFVHSAPFFSEPIPVSFGDVVYSKYKPSSNEDASWDTGFYFLDVY